MLCPFCRSLLWNYWFEMHNNHVYDIKTLHSHEIHYRLNTCCLLDTHCNMGFAKKFSCRFDCLPWFSLQLDHCQIKFWILMCNDLGKDWRYWKCAWNITYISASWFSKQKILNVHAVLLYQQLVSSFHCFLQCEGLQIFQVRAREVPLWKQVLLFACLPWWNKGRCGATSSSATAQCWWWYWCSAGEFCCTGNWTYHGDLLTSWILCIFVLFLLEKLCYLMHIGCLVC
jgi:hypothetical protein